MRILNYDIFNSDQIVTMALK